MDFFTIEWKERLKTESIVIGGGFFGLYVGLLLAKCGRQVRILERECAPMQRASLHNQARVHQGYHYPRSLLTGLRSRISFPIFAKDFEECIDSSFDKLYMVSSRLGKVTPNQFQQFCNRIGAPCVSVNSKYCGLVNPNLVDGIFQTEEYAFDARRLMTRMLADLDSHGISVETDTEVLCIEEASEEYPGVHVKWRDPNGVEHRSLVGSVFNCTYSSINEVNQRSGLPIIDFKHEWTEMILVEPTAELKGLGITLMCGPFFSLMPYPAENCYSFSHVRYTPHHSWHESNDPSRHVQRPPCESDRSNWNLMIRDAARYIPAISSTRKLRSMWEVKTVLPRSEGDDSRPILFKAHHGMRNYHCIMGGKIDNIYDIAHELQRENLI